MGVCNPQMYDSKHSHCKDDSHRGYIFLPIIPHSEDEFEQI